MKIMLRGACRQTIKPEGRVKSLQQTKATAGGDKHLRPKDAYRYDVSLVICVVMQT